MVDDAASIVQRGRGAVAALLVPRIACDDDGADLRALPDAAVATVRAAADDPAAFFGESPAPEERKKEASVREASAALGEYVARNAKVFGVTLYASRAGCVASGSGRLALAVVASLFAARHGFHEDEEITEEDRKELDLISGAFKANSDASREERQFRLWINSLGIRLVHGKGGAAPEPLVVTDLYEDLRSGHVLVAVADTVVDGIVHWKKVNRKRKLNRFRKIENCNYALELSRKMGLTVVNIGAFDIVDANHKLILGLLWQYMRYHTLKILASLYKIEGRDADEDDILAWGNAKVMHAGRAKSQINSFRDPALRSSVFLLDLLDAMAPGIVKRRLLVLPADTDEARTSNARYVISSAQKLGCYCFVLPEDIVLSHHKMIMIFVAGLMLLDQQGERQQKDPHDSS